MSQTSSAHFIMQMRLAGAAQISPPFEIGGCCLLFFFHSSFFSLWVVSEKALWFLADSWSLGERGRQEGGGPTDSLFLPCPILSFLCRRQWGDMSTGQHILSLSKLLGRVWPGEVSLGLGMGTSGLGGVLRNPLG